MIERLNAADHGDFVRLLSEVFEHSPWVAHAVVDHRPFRDVEQLHREMCAAVAAAPRASRLALIRTHPDLAVKAAIAAELTEASSREQTGAGLDRLAPDQYSRFHRLNAEYRRRFGFPFIIAVRGYDAAGILDEFTRRLENTREEEERKAVAQIERIARFRLEELFG